MDKDLCQCGSCPLCSALSGAESIMDDSGVLIIEVLDPDKDKLLKNLEENMPLTDAGGIVLASLNELKVSSGIIKIAAKHKPNNPKLWSKCIAEAKKKFKVFPSAYSNAFAARLYKKKGGTWRTVKSGKGK